MRPTPCSVIAVSAVSAISCSRGLVEGSLAFIRPASPWPDRLVRLGAVLGVVTRFSPRRYRRELGGGGALDTRPEM